MADPREIIARRCTLGNGAAGDYLADAILSDLTAAGYRIIGPGEVDPPAYDAIHIPPDIADFGARHKIEEFGNATYRNGYMDGYRAALRALGETK